MIEAVILREAGFEGVEGGFLVGALAAAFQGEAEAEDKEAPHEPGEAVPAEGDPHGGGHLSVAGEDRGRVLGAPPLDGEVDDGDVDGGEDGEDGAEGAGLAGGGEAARHEVGDVEEPEEEEGGEARVPGPPDAPTGSSPEHAGGETDGGEDDGDLGGRDGDGIGGEGGERIAAAEVKEGEGSDEVDVGEDQAEERGGDVPVEDALDVAHGGFCGCDEDGLAEAVGEEREGGGEPGEGEEEGGPERSRPVCGEAERRAGLRSRRVALRHVGNFIAFAEGHAIFVLDVVPAGFARTRSRSAVPDLVFRSLS
jgi:hypothetical protein